MKLKERSITLPELILIAGTRAAIGVGVGLLVKEKLNKDQRRGAGLGLVILGGLSTIPLALGFFSKRDENLVKRNQRQEKQMKRSEVMTKDPSCCLRTAAPFDAAQLMLSEDDGPRPVVIDTRWKNSVGIGTHRQRA